MINEQHILVDEPGSRAVGESSATFLFAHGAGAPMDSAFMNAFALGLAERGLRVVRFEFEYMHRRRLDGSRRPPERAVRLVEQLREFASLYVSGQTPGRLLIGGKSMGGRIASMLVAEDGAMAAGLICLGYPFHPRGKPDKLRTSHLAALKTPTLICQGERDPLGCQDEVDGYVLSPAIELLWLPDGDHDLKPRKASGHTQERNWNRAMDRIAEFAGRALA